MRTIQIKFTSVSFHYYKTLTFSFFPCFSSFNSTTTGLSWGKGIWNKNNKKKLFSVLSFHFPATGSRLQILFPHMWKSLSFDNPQWRRNYTFFSFHWTLVLVTYLPTKHFWPWCKCQPSTHSQSPPSHFTGLQYIQQCQV
jgi:hypothetical protein